MAAASGPWFEEGVCFEQIFLCEAWLLLAKGVKCISLICLGSYVHHGGCSKFLCIFADMQERSIVPPFVIPLVLWEVKDLLKLLSFLSCHFFCFFFNWEADEKSLLVLVYFWESFLWWIGFLQLNWKQFSDNSLMLKALLSTEGPYGKVLFKGVSVRKMWGYSGHFSRGL